MIFNYWATDSNGKEIKGKVTADSHEDACDYLLEQNYKEITVRRFFAVDEIH